MTTMLESSTQPSNGQSSDDRKQSPPAFLDLADSVSHLSSSAMYVILTLSAHARLLGWVMELQMFLL